jgi:hypothetical protein
MTYNKQSYCITRGQCKDWRGPGCKQGILSANFARIHPSIPKILTYYWDFCYAYLNNKSLLFCSLDLRLFKKYLLHLALCSPLSETYLKGCRRKTSAPPPLAIPPCWRLATAAALYVFLYIMHNCTESPARLGELLAAQQSQVHQLFIEAGGRGLLRGHGGGSSEVGNQLWQWGRGRGVYTVSHGLRTHRGSPHAQPRNLENVEVVDT